MNNHDIPRKAGKVLNIFILSLLLILARVWYLEVIEHDKYKEIAKKPQRRVVIESVERGPIYDRFGIPMAINQIQYNAAVCYAHIREIPTSSWVRDPEGKLVRVQERMNHISKLAKLLSDELHLDPTVIEDTIHAKAALFPHTPFVVKENISEKEYFRLKALEKDWLGLQTQRSFHRHYPLGKVGCDILGYMGAISGEKYRMLAAEIHTLEEYVQKREEGEYPPLPKGYETPIQVRARLHELYEKAYTINDWIGKAGVEASYEEALRGVCGKKIMEVDTKGNILRELPGGRPAYGGKAITLTISAKLQEFAEELLAANEGKDPWMKGSAIVAMIPDTGEVVAMASYPRFNPNDFISLKDKTLKKEKEGEVQKWLESEKYLASIWDGKKPLERETYSFVRGRYDVETKTLTWPLYLDIILPQGVLRQSMDRIETIEKALSVQEEGLFHPYLKEIMAKEDRILLVDLCHLIAPRELFSREVAHHLRSLPLDRFFAMRQSAVNIQDALRDELATLFHDVDFASWRKAHFKEYLKKKRKEEQENRTYTKPYTDYLESAEKQLFKKFWESYRWIFTYISLSGKTPIDQSGYPNLKPYVEMILKRRNQWRKASHADLEQLVQTLPPALGLAFLKTLKAYDDLQSPLMGHYARMRHEKGAFLEKHLAGSFYPINGYGYGMSQAFRQTSPQGSVFKLVTTYTFLMDRYSQGKPLNPMVIIDDYKGDRKTQSLNQVLGYFPDGRPILRLYKGARLPRSSHPKIGRIDLLGAIEQSSNIYFSLLVSDYLENPNALKESAQLFGYGEKTGVDLPAEAKGNVPDDLAQNRNGLYSMAIGQHSLVVTPLQTAAMIAAIANKGDLVRPKVVKEIKGKEGYLDDELLSPSAGFPYEEELSSIGIYFPLFTTAHNFAKQETARETPVKVQRSIFFPKDVYNMITTGMERVIKGERGSARPSGIRALYDHPKAIHDYHDLKNDLWGKTGTAQILYKTTLDVSTEAQMRSHIWFTAVSFPPETRLSPTRFENPELVVVVFQKFGYSGRDAAPIAGQVIQKWRMLKKNPIEQ